MSQEELTCLSCHEPVINIFKIGWAHKNMYSICPLKDGLHFLESDRNIWEIEVTDPVSRLFFINKFNEMQKNALNGDLTPNSEKIPQEKRLNSENLTPREQWRAISKEISLLNSPSGQIVPLKKKNIGFEIYHDEPIRDN